MNATKAVCAAAATAAFAMSAHHAAAQEFSTRPVRLVTIFAPGSASDNHARFLADKLSPHLGQAVIVDNKPGAGGLVATRDVLRSQPLGYSMLYSTPEVTANPFVYKNPGYKFDDLAVVGPLGVGSYAFIIHNSVPAKTVAEFVAYAKKNPGKLNYGSLGPTAGNTILAERFKQAAGIDMVAIPFKGGAPIAVALLAGQIHVYFPTLYTGMARMKNPQIVGLAVTSAQRMKAVPDMPTLIEQGYNVQLTYWSSVFVPAVAPKVAIERLRDAMRKVTSAADTKALLGKQAIDTWSGTVDEFATFIKKEAAELQADYKRLNIPLMD